MGQGTSRSGGNSYWQLSIADYGASLVRASRQMELTPGSWTELWTGVATAAVAGVLGAMAWRQGQRANRLTEAALDVQFEAEDGTLLLVVRGVGATVWVHSVRLVGGVAARMGPEDSFELTQAGVTGPLAPQGMGPPPWRCHRGLGLTFDSPFDEPPESYSATLQVNYTLTGTGDEASHLINLGTLVG